MEKVLATFETILIDNQIDFDNVYNIKLKIPENLRKFIPYRGYIGTILVDKNLIGSIYNFCEVYSDELLTEEFKPCKISKGLYNKLKEIDEFIRKSEYNNKSELFEYINKHTECVSPAFKLVKVG